MRRHLAGSIAALGLSVLSACGDAGTGTGVDSTTIQAVVAVDSASGTLALTIASGTLSLVAGPDYAAQAPLASVSVTGTLTIQGGATVSLTGTYDTGAHTLSVSGGGYTFTGSYAGGILSGTFTTSGGATGGFAGASGADNVQSFCGGFHHSDPLKPDAVFNILVDFTTGVVTGTGVGGDKVPAAITGTVSGTGVTISFALKEGAGGATGTISATTLSGTWHSPEESGNWTGGTCS
jgi:hypothetical protein